MGICVTAFNEGLCGLVQGTSAHTVLPRNTQISYVLRKIVHWSVFLRETSLFQH